MHEASTVKRPPERGDRVTFDTPVGTLAGFIADFRHHVGNGELHAWVELDNELPDQFHAVPLSAIKQSDHFGPPSRQHFEGCSAAYAARLLNPEDLGLAVSPATRDAARIALGRQAVEGGP